MPGAAQVAPASAPELKSLLSIVVGSLVVAALYLGQDVLIPITLAVMLSFVVSPVIAALQRCGLRRGPAVAIAVLATLASIGAVGTLIGSQAASLADRAPQYARTIERKVEGLQVSAITRFARVTENLGDARRSAPPASVANDAARTAARPPPIPVRLVDEPTAPFAVAWTVLQPILGPLETTVIVLVVAIFILMQREDLRDRFIRLFGSNDLHRTTRAMDDAGERLSRYFLSQLAVNTTFGVAISLGLWVIGVPSPAMWDVVAGILRFVPYIGPVLAVLAPAALAAAVDPGWTMTIEVVALFVVIEPLTGYVVEPLVYGRSTGLSPVSVIVAAIFWTWLWGPIGLIMSTPLTLILVVMGRHVKSLEFIDVILGDRPALTPVETFYQRVLANNVDEALAQAETLLTDKTPTAYYDDVVVPGLKLAAEDAARGTLDQERQIQMIRIVQTIIEDLKDDAGSTECGQAPRVICVPGPGVFDEVVATIVAQLVEVRGVPVRIVRNRDTSRGAIGSLDLGSPEAIAICYLELMGTPAPLRYHIKRLRARAASAQIITGNWTKGDAVLQDEALQQAVGSDRYARSIAEIVQAVVEEAGSHESASVLIPRRLSATYPFTRRR